MRICFPRKLSLLIRSASEEVLEAASSLISRWEAVSRVFLSSFAIASSKLVKYLIK